MKKFIVYIGLMLFIISPIFVNASASSTLSGRLKGRILLQVEEKGEAWYVSPVNDERYYMANGEEAYNIMRNLGIGISNINLNKFKKNKAEALKHKGKIFLQVESRGEAYYIDFSGNAHYLQNGAEAYKIMRMLGLGITNKDLKKINVRKDKQDILNLTSPKSDITANKDHEKEVQILNDENPTHLVTQVVDGDTIKVNIDGRLETLRLIGIDTPETVDPRKLVQCFGKEATNKANELLSGQRVRLEADITQGERDSYNRLLRYVFLEDGTFFNELMIKEGYAHEYTYNSNPYKYQIDFMAAERSARINGVGLWSQSACSISPNQAPDISKDELTVGPTVGPHVKKSKSNICHEKGSTYYHQTINFSPYSSITACLGSGGRLPKK